MTIIRSVLAGSLLASFAVTGCGRTSPHPQTAPSPVIVVFDVVGAKPLADAKFIVTVLDRPGIHHAPITAAQVALVMPSMTMPPNIVHLKKDASGHFSGTGTFTMAGAWNATVHLTLQDGTSIDQTFPRKSMSETSFTSAVGLYLLPFLWGLGGGFSHCIGMCGIFVISASGVNAATRGAISSRQTLPRHVLFHTGRLVSLGLLGAGGGVIGSLAGFAAHFARLQGWLSILVGGVLILLAFGYVGILPGLRMPEPDVLGAGGGVLRRTYASVLRSKSLWQPGALGLMVGLLPCGQTYTVLIAAAAAQSVLRGVLVMLAFGLGTIPGLLTFGMAASWFSGLIGSTRFRIGMTRLSAIVMVMMAVVMIWRGLPNLKL